MANLLTAIRLLLIGPVALSLAGIIASPAWLLLLLIVVAIATDYFDGKVARRLGTASANGMLFDHSTDFLFVTSGLFGLSYAGMVPLLLPCLIVLAFSQYVLDSYFLFRQKSLRMSTLGRRNGVLYFGPILLASVARLELTFAPHTVLDLAAIVLSYLLIISTAASIIDRARAPWQSANKS